MPASRPPFFSQRRFGAERQLHRQIARELLAPIEVRQRPLGVRDPGRSARRPGRRAERRARCPSTWRACRRRVAAAAVRQAAPELEVAAFRIEWPPDDSQVNGCTSGISSAVRSAVRRAQDVEVRALDAGVADQRPSSSVSDVSAERRVPRLDHAERVVLVHAAVVRGRPSRTRAARRRASERRRRRAGDRLGVGERRLCRRAAWRSTRTTPLL